MTDKPNYRPFLDYSGRIFSGTRQGEFNAPATLGPPFITATAVPFWGDSPEAWDTIYFNGVPLPGTCIVGGKAFEVKRDAPVSPGKHGSHLKVLGRHPAEPEFRLTLWTAAHLEAYFRLMAAFLPEAGKAMPAAVNVVHPQLSIYKIKRVRLMTASFLTEREPQVYEATLKCFEDALKDGRVSGKGDKGPTIKGTVTTDSVRNAFKYSPPDATNGNAPRTVASYLGK